jgi:D-lactate dehydrogenase
MTTVVYSTHNFEKEFLVKAIDEKEKVKYLQVALTKDTVELSKHADAVSLFVSDDAGEAILIQLNNNGVKFIALRSAGYNNVNLKVAKQLGIKVARVPAYSPYAVAEHAIALMLALNRKLIKANTRVHDLNFSLDGLTGFDMNGKTVGIIGAGKIGAIAIKILHGFGCKILVVDEQVDEELYKYDVTYTDHQTLYAQSDIISLHAPLTPGTKYVINEDTIAKMKKGVMLINTSRGALINTKDIIEALKTGHIAYLGLDVYEEEGGLFFEDHSEDILQDDTISRLLTFKNVLITSHQAFLTATALENIAATTAYNIDCFANNVVSENEVL